MIIRCERCSTMYELEDSLLAPTGSQVQCTRCQHVFTAFPPGAAGRTLTGIPAQPSQPSDEPRGTPRAAEPPPSDEPRGAPRAAEPPPPSRPPAAPARPDKPQPHRAPWNGVPPVYRPVASTPRARTPSMRRDSVGVVEARLRSRARGKWLAPLAAVVLVAAGAAAWFLLAGRGDAELRRAHRDALALVAADDTASLERATSALTEAVRRAPGHAGVAADRALSLVLRAAAVGDEAEALATRAAARADERDRLTRERPSGWEAAAQEVAAASAALESEARAREEHATALAASALEALRAAQADAGDTREGARALALHHASRGERDRALAVARAARQRGDDDPWLEIAGAWLESRDPDRAAREGAAAKLARLAAARPDLLRARYLLARTQASLGRRPEALATLDAVLAANPRHEGAKRLRDELGSEPAAVQAPALPAPVKAPTQQRKTVSQPGEGAEPQPDAPPAGAPPPTAAPRRAPAASGTPPATVTRSQPSPSEPPPPPSAEPPSPPEAGPSSPPPSEEVSPAPPPAPPPVPQRRRSAPVVDPPETTNGG